jgi:hypothetical protein
MSSSRNFESPQSTVYSTQTPGTLSFTAHAQDNLLWEVDQGLQSMVKLSYRMDTLNFGLGNNVFDFPIAHKSKNIENYIKYL